jgi:predicted transcriptional regulator
MTPRKLHPLSPTEWRLMSCVWELEAANPPQVSEHLRTKLGEELSPKTAGIFLARLEEKGYLRSAPGPALAGRGRPPHFYQAMVTRDESLRWQLEKFLEDHLIDDASLALLERLLSQRREHPAETTLETPGDRRHHTSPHGDAEGRSEGREEEPRRGSQP